MNYAVGDRSVNAKRIQVPLWALVVALTLALLATPALAQEAAAPAAEGAEVAEDDGLPELDEDDPMYWAEMREVYVMQQRAFLKEGRFALTLYGGIIPNNIFEQYLPLGVRANYFLLENIGLELAGSYAFRRDTQLRDTLRDESGADAQEVLIGDGQASHVNFGVMWSPVYGKLAYYNDRIIYLDMNIFGGAGMVVAQTQSDFNSGRSTTAKPEGVLGAGIALYLGEHASVRADYRQFIFAKVNGGVAKPSEVSLGFSWFF
ncbi:outer membrane beta-barrel domain-containing protein [Lujinxingia vulgaris]|uniref:Outer membrane beta-barrel domain-containing protein n=1 Tax=Lujinxingia vulgaris TaxID=2600176 RepID=A0A5C6XAD1_9DELT|nr:outer membrane beta-barrel domain-containing protein [Lujinxingia vulgaris]